MPTSAERPWPSAFFGWAWVVLLFIVFACSFIDRQILSLMVDPIRADLNISDTQFGLLHGLSFALLYCSAGIPVGYLVDHRRRGRIIAGGLFFWSVMTAVCGLSSHYWQLFLARMGVGIGEATLSPSSYSLLADCFPPQKLARALSVFISGAGMGAGLAMLAGGFVIDYVQRMPPTILPLVGELRSWQAVFLLVGLPGIPLAIIVALFREPERRDRAAGSAVASWADFRAFLRRRARLIFGLTFGAGFGSAISIAVLSWLPAFLMRAHGQSSLEVGITLGIVTVIGITGGLLAGALLAERLAARGTAHAELKVMAWALSATGVAAALVAAAGSVPAAYAAITLLLLFTNMPFGIAAAGLQGYTPGALRGRMSAVYLLLQNAFGMVLGSLIPALLNDTLFPGRGDRIGVSLAMSIAVFGVAGAALLAMARRAADDPAPT